MYPTEILFNTATIREVNISLMVTAISVAGVLSSGRQAGCNANFLSRF